MTSPYSTDLLNAIILGLATQFAFFAVTYGTYHGSWWTFPQMLSRVGLHVQSAETR
jgi:hypothetical protein